MAGCTYVNKAENCAGTEQFVAYCRILTDWQNGNYKDVLEKFGVFFEKDSCGKI